MALIAPPAHQEPSLCSWPASPWPLGVYNIVLKATWTLMDDGVFWRPGPQGVVAGRVAAGGPADSGGRRAGDVLLASTGKRS